MKTSPVFPSAPIGLYKILLYNPVSSMSVSSFVHSVTIPMKAESQLPTERPFKVLK